MRVKFLKRKNRFTVLTNSTKETRKLGKLLAEESLKTFSNRALVFGLTGELGGGKTTFLQGFGKGLGIKKQILSPSFLIFRRFKISGNKNFLNFYHFDCYRIENEKEILNLGFKEIISNPENIVAIEWADKISKVLPKDHVILNFKFVDKNKRRITIKL